MQVYLGTYELPGIFPYLPVLKLHIAEQPKVLLFSMRAVTTAIFVARPMEL